MIISRALMIFSLCANAALAQELQPVIARPATLPRGALEVTLHGTYTNWATGVTADLSPVAVAGETLSAGLDFGATDGVQVGVATSLPIHPGAGFGSILGSAAFAVSHDAAVRLDAGFESLGFNGDGTGGLNHVNRYFGGIGAPIKVPLSSMVAFVSGRTGAVQFGHFNNIGQAGTALYLGASLLPELSTDLLVVSVGNHDSATAIGVNLPAGLLLQPDPRFALTLFAGYSVAIAIPRSGSGASTQSLHFLPIGIEAVVTPASQLDIGARFSLDGYFAQIGASSDVVAGGPGYFDLRALMVWLRFRTG